MTVDVNPVPSVDSDIDPLKYPALAKFALPLLPPAGAIIGRDNERTDVLSSLNRPRLSNLLLLAPAGSGKLLTLDTAIPTPSGWTTMGELSVGDEVFGRDGLPTSVSFCSEIEESPELYDVRFSDGSVIRACADHQWKVSSAAQREAAGDDDAPESVMTTAQMIAAGVRVGSNDAVNFSVRPAESLVLPYRELPMSPYVLGRWLAVDSDDPGVLVTPEKAIPPSFLRGSYGQRLLLAQGLFDHKGTVNADGVTEVVLPTELLAAHVAELLRTLGITVIQDSVDGQYRLSMTTDLPVFSYLSDTMYMGTEAPAERPLLYIEAITSVPSEPGRCIQVDNHEHMYVAGEGFIPTHNTVLVQDTMMHDTSRIYLEVDLAKMNGSVERADQMAALIKSVFDEAEKFASENGRELVLFIDEFHQIVQMSPAAVEALKPVLAASGTRGLKIIGATTFEEWLTYIRPNKPLDERLQRVNLSPATRSMTVKILRSFATEEGVIGQIGDDNELFEEIHDLTNRHIPSSVQPRKSINLLDGMIGRHRTTEEPMSTALMAKVLRQSTGVNLDFAVDGTSIKSELDRRVLSQDMATSILSDQLQVVVAGLNDPNKPKSRFLFAGSTGVGKTEITKQLVDLLFQDDLNRLIRFDMSEFALDSSLDLFRYELTNKVVSMGDAVILLDEVEKASRVVIRLMLQVLDDARLSDSNNREVSFKDCHIILTTNAGSEVFSRINDYAADDTGSGEEMVDFMKQIENSIRDTNGFPPELLGRLDRIVPFQPLSDETKRNILKRALDNLSKEVLAKHGVILGIHSRVLEYLAVDVGESASDAGGAREAMRTLQGEVKVAVAKHINAHPEDKQLFLVIEGDMRAENMNLRKSQAKPVVKTRIT